MRRWIWVLLIAAGCTGMELEGEPETGCTDGELAGWPADDGGGAAWGELDPVERCPGIWCMDPTNTREVCVDSMTDPENCGACGVTCIDTCIDGACPCACEGGRFLLLNDLRAPCPETDVVALGCEGGVYVVSTGGAPVAVRGLALTGCDALAGVAVCGGDEQEMYAVRVE